MTLIYYEKASKGAITIVKYRVVHTTGKIQPSGAKLGVSNILYLFLHV